MPYSSKSVAKRVRQDETKRMRNRMTEAAMKTQLKKFKAALETKAENLQEVLQKTVEIIDKTASSGVIHKNNADRRKARLSKKVTDLLK